MILHILLALACQVAPRPNVLVIVADDLGWPERPLLTSLDGLAAQGVTFERAYAQPTCSIARIEMMHGRLHRREGIGDLSMNAHDPAQDRLRFDVLSVAELFNPRGYSSMLIGKWHLGRASLNGEMDQVPSGPYCQGWKWCAGSPTITNAGSGSTGYYKWWRVEAGDMFLETAYATSVQRDQFISWWTDNGGVPKLAYLCWSAPHSDNFTVGGTPYDPPPGFSLQGTNRANYEQVVAYLNTALAAVLAVVDLGNTYVFVTADNGTPEDAHPIGEPDGRWKFTTYEGGVRVPLVVAGPGVSAGVTTQRLVSLVDLPATAAELACVQIEAGFEDSLSFADELGAWAGTPARGFVSSERYGAVSYPSPGYDDQAVIEGTWKLRCVDTDGPGPIQAVDTFYFLRSPGVEMPLTPSPTVQARLHSELASLPPRAP